MRKNITLPNKITFCKKPWRLPVLALGLLVLLTFMWCFYLFDDYLDDEDWLGYAIPSLDFIDAVNPDWVQLRARVMPTIVKVSGSGTNAKQHASGVLVNPQGYVITNAHAVAKIENIQVWVRTMSGYKPFPAEVVKTLHEHDLVLLKLVTNERFLYLTCVRSEHLTTGYPVMALGVGFAGQTLVKPGVVDANNVSLQVGEDLLSHLVRTSAIYTWEQSGGALVDATGKLVGINLVINDDAGNTLGYAVPAHVLEAHFQDVVKLKVATQEQQLWPIRRVNLPANAVNPQIQGAPMQPVMQPMAASWWSNARATNAK